MAASFLLMFRVMCKGQFDVAIKKEYNEQYKTRVSLPALYLALFFATVSNSLD